LGQEISEDGVRPGSCKVEALLNAPTPRNVKQVRQFMGLASYFRKFIPEFASRAACITKLTRNNEKCIWGEEQEAARSYICAYLSKRPLLVIFDPELETELHTDASSVGFGAILFQRHEKQLKVVAYFSRRATEVESNYHSYELETLAVYYAIKHFCVYLTGIAFKLVTDCNSLKLTKTKKDLPPRVARWWMYLQAFNFTIEYRKGKYVAHVDYLSRNPIRPPPVLSALVITADNWLKITQRRDPETQEIKLKLTEGKLTTEYFCQNDILYRKINPGQNPPIYRAFVPKGSRLGVLRMFHDEQCHVGPDKTFAKINHFFWFPGMAKFVKKYCDHCLKCIAGKKHTGPKQGSLHPIDKIPDPFHTVHGDCVGPFPVTPEGFKHLLLLIDAFTKYLFLIPLKTLAGPETRDKLRIYLNIFQTTKRFICDQGTNFTDQCVKDLLSEMRIELHLIAKSAPRGNGQVERYVSTVLDLLRTEIESKPAKSEWTSVIPKLQFTLNNTVQKSTGFSPLYLVTGQEISSPDITVLTSSILPTLATGQNLEKNRILAYERTQRNAASAKKRFDRSRKDLKNLQPGDIVFHPSGNSHLSKLDRRYEGPLEVLKLLPNDRVQLKNLATNRKRVVAREMLKAWSGELAEDSQTKGERVC
jgi:transposase InsO family protein